MNTSTSPDEEGARFFIQSYIVPLAKLTVPHKD